MSNRDLTIRELREKKINLECSLIKQIQQFVEDTGVHLKEGQLYNTFKTVDGQRGYGVTVTLELDLS